MRLSRIGAAPLRSVFYSSPPQITPRGNWRNNNG
jgi:hypothetical protein